LCPRYRCLIITMNTCGGHWLRLQWYIFQKLSKSFCFFSSLIQSYKFWFHCRTGNACLFGRFSRYRYTSKSKYVSTSWFQFLKICDPISIAIPFKYMWIFLYLKAYSL